MIVKLKGKNGRLDVTEKDVESVTVSDDEIAINYKKPYKWGIVSGVRYFPEEYSIMSVSEK